MVEHKSEMKIYFVAIVQLPTPAVPKVGLLQGKQRLKNSVLMWFVLLAVELKFCAL